MPVIKIGSTQHPVVRRQHWRNKCGLFGWKYDDCQRGQLIHVEPASSLRNAFCAEKIAHKVLWRHQSWPTYAKERQSEWYAAPTSLLINVVVLAVDFIESGEPDPISPDFYDSLYKLAAV